MPRTHHLQRPVASTWFVAVLVAGSTIAGLAPAAPAGAAGSCNGLPVTIEGTPGPDNLLGTDGNDVISLLDGNDTVDALGGLDTICVGDGVKTIDGGPSRFARGDTVVYAGTTVALTIDLANGSATGRNISHTLIDIENVVGGGGSDTIIGSDGPNRLNGAAGNDTIRPAGGNDAVIGGAGARDRVEFIDSPTAVDVDLSAGTATGDGSDSITTIEDITGSLQVDRLTGSDVANRIDSGASTAGNTPGEFLDGRAGDDLLTGDAGFQILIGGPGADVLRGFGGRDDLYAGLQNAVSDSAPNTLDGGDGNDHLHSDLGDDTIVGGPGAADLVFYLTSPAAVTVSLAGGSATGMGTDTLSGVEDIEGSPFDDILTGSGAGNRIAGKGGNDTLSGLGGPDQLIGGFDDDGMDGGPGEDFCQGRDQSFPDDSLLDTAVGCETVDAVP